MYVGMVGIPTRTRVLYLQYYKKYVQISTTTYRYCRYLGYVSPHSYYTGIYVLCFVLCHVRVFLLKTTHRIATTTETTGRNMFPNGTNSHGATATSKPAHRLPRRRRRRLTLQPPLLSLPLPLPQPPLINDVV